MKEESWNIYCIINVTSQVGHLNNTSVLECVWTWVVKESLAKQTYFVIVLEMFIKRFSSVCQTKLNWN